VTHRDPRFFENPLEFDPERFSAGRIDEFPDGAYFPFGHGARVCVGKHLAMMQLTLIVATVLRNVVVSPIGDCSDLTINRDLSIRPATKCVVTVRRRHN
jgi:cytochrome P450